MAFDSNGNQTGSDSNLNTLVNLNNLETIQLGDCTLYHPINTQLNINGGLSFNPSTEKLFFNNQVDTSIGGAQRDHDIHVRSGGTFTVDDFTIVDGERAYGRTPVYISRRPSPSGGGGAHILNFTGSSFAVDNGGTATLTGGYYETQHNFAVNNGGQIDLEGCEIRGNGDRFWLNGGSTSTINDVKLQDFQIYFNSFPTQLERTTFVDCVSIVSEIGRSGFDPQPNIILSPVWIGSSPVVGLWFKGWLRVKNSLGGTSLGINTFPSNPNSEGIADFVQDVQFRVLDLQGVGVGDFVFYATESDDGNRRAHVNGTTTFDNRDVRILNWVTGSQGLTNNIEVRLGAGVDPTRATTNANYLYTQYANTNNDEYDVSGVGYTTGFIVKRYQFRANGELLLNEVALPDTLITEPVKATAAAYTQQETAAKVYDQLKSFLVDNYAGETETIVTRTGNTLDARALDVTYDNVGSGPATVVGNTLTINASMFLDNVTTTGTVTGKEFVAGSVIDATQDTTLSTSISVNEWYLYENIANANADINRLVSSPSGSTQGFLLSSLPTTTGLVMRYVQGTAISFETNISLTTGVNTVELGLQAGVNNITATVQESSIISKYAGHITVDTMDGETGTAFPFGTDLRPVDTIANGITIAELYGIYSLEIRGDNITLPQTILGYTIGSARVPDVTSPDFPFLVVSTTMDFAHCNVNKIGVTGAFNPTIERGITDFYGCVLANVSGLEANVIDSKLAGTINCAYDSEFNNCYGSVTLDCTGLVGRTINFIKFSGNITITNLTDPSTIVYVGCLSADITIDSSCTAGFIVPVDYDRLTNNGTSTVDAVSQHIITQTAISNLNDFDPLVDTVTVSAINNNVITSSTIASNAFNNSAFTTGYYNAIGAEVDSSVSGLATQVSVDAIPTNPLLVTDVRLDSYSTFDPTTDTVARVTLVDTTTANSDMRGTDGANTVAPDNASITAILADTNELQLNQGDWLTATGFSTHSQDDVVTAMRAVADDFKTDVSALATQVSVNAIPTNPALTTDVRFNNLDAAISSRLAASAYTAPPTPADIWDNAVRTVTGGTINTNTDYVAPDNASITAILEDTNELQLNQNNWLTATGFSTHSPSDVVTSMQIVADDFKADLTGLPTAEENADALLGRNIAGGSNGVRTVTEALRASRNRVDMRTGDVYEEDDQTVSHTFTVTRAVLDSVAEVDPE